MGKRKIIIRQSVADKIAEVAWFIESKGMVKTAEKFADAVYDFIESLGNDLVIHPICHEPERSFLGLKCKNFRKKYVVVFMESSKEITVCEFIPAKLIKW